MDMRQNWSLPQLTDNDYIFVLQQDGAPRHFRRSVHELPNNALQTVRPAELELQIIG
jgi:hypothetical protein